MQRIYVIVIIIALILFAHLMRYQIVGASTQTAMGAYVLDRWTGKITCYIMDEPYVSTPHTSIPHGKIVSPDVFDKLSPNN